MDFDLCFNESVPEIGKTKIAGFNDKTEITNMCEGPITVDFTIDSEAKLFEMEISELQRKEEKSRKTIKCLESERLRLLVSMTKYFAWNEVTSLKSSLALQGRRLISRTQKFRE